MNLTTRQAEILAFIKASIYKTGVPPTRKEISAQFGFASPNAAEDHLKALQKKGAIFMFPGVSRGIRVVKKRRRGIQTEDSGSRLVAAAPDLLAALRRIVTRTDLGEIYRTAEAALAKVEATHEQSL